MSAPSVEELYALSYHLTTQARGLLLVGSFVGTQPACPWEVDIHLSIDCARLIVRWLRLLQKVSLQ